MQRMNGPTTSELLGNRLVCPRSTKWHDRQRYRSQLSDASVRSFELLRLRKKIRVIVANAKMQATELYGAVLSHPWQPICPFKLSGISTEPGIKGVRGELPSRARTRALVWLAASYGAHRSGSGKSDGRRPADHDASTCLRTATMSRGEFISAT